MPTVNTNTGWGALRTFSSNSTEIQYFALGLNVVRIYYDGSSTIKYQWSQDEGSSWQTAVTVDTTAGNNDVMLNTNITYDKVTGRLHFLYGRNIDAGGSNAVLCHRYTDNPFTASPTFSAEHVIDSGSVFGFNTFYRVALAAYNSNVTVHYTGENNSTFTTDGKIWRAKSTDGGATWGSPALAFTGLVGPYEPNCCIGSDGSVFVTWYDDGSNTNQKGDLYIAISRDGGVTWPSAGTKLTTTTDYGRPRPACDSGNVWIIANKPWNALPAFQADVWSLTSNDNGATWGSPTQRGAHSGASNLDHPDVIVVNSFVGMIWNDQSTNPSTRSFIYSADAGSTFSSPVNVLPGLTVGSTSDAPRLLATSNRVLAFGYDSSSSPQHMVWNANPFFALLPKVETSLIDDFSSYTNGTLLNTGNWTTTTLGSVPLKANGASGVTRGASAGTFNRAGSYRNDVTYTGNAEVWSTITADGTGGEADIYIWDPVNKNGYVLVGAKGDFGNLHAVSKYTAGVGSQFVSDAVAASTGEVMALQVVGNFVVGYKLVSSVWYEVGSFRNLETTYRSSLKLEMEIAGSANAGPTMGAFGGGTLVVPANTVAPVASGTVTNGSVLTVTEGTWSGAPSRTLYQWQTSPDGTTWTNVSGATLSFFTVTSGTLQHRCVVTDSNSVGSASANSNALLPAGAGSVEAWGRIQL